ncbi:MAG: acyl-CoA dehydrogenase N-terminal domain-containing protein, partial [Deltaproteobacteria bacterium]|nr:acyl-CoA dehydrogenase N-terminal domain-containing protein [Deltaproteobacteria bacterium]
MAAQFISFRNLQFLLYEQLDAAALTRYSCFADHSKETFDMVLETAMRMGRGMLFSTLGEMDRKPPEFRDGKVFVHPIVA